VSPSASRAAAVFRPENEKSQPARPSSGVVDGRAQPPARADSGDVEQLTVAARHQQQEEGVGDIRRQPRRDGMALQMVHRDQRQIER
jgi:hypothetical protein